ncbi:hypothetical protein H8K52_14130 [Undibacterium seohonense]|uniref:Uncharacterized protein n=1 Tax=Undibacterium seohonense TaxID=1344950 RepID=A0ABR6X6F5_9BURK|nr:hypothetical protein [Undibacterium seohonense]
MNICYNIVSGLLGGEIHVNSIVGVGTKFMMTIPLVVQEN